MATQTRASVTTSLEMPVLAHSGFDRETIRVACGVKSSAYRKPVSEEGEVVREGGPTRRIKYVTATARSRRRDKSERGETASERGYKTLAPGIAGGVSERRAGRGSLSRKTSSSPRASPVLCTPLGAQSVDCSPWGGRGGGRCLSRRGS